MNPKLLFLKRKGGLGEKENFFSQEKKLSLSPKNSRFLIKKKDTRMRVLWCDAGDYFVEVVESFWV